MKPRRVQRYSVQLPAVLQGDGPERQGTIVNLSIYGCAVLAEWPVPVGSYVKIGMELAMHERLLEIELAAVRWRMGSRFGCEFIKVQPPMKSRLAEFVRLLESPPAG